MAVIQSGQWLNQFVAPQLLKELRDYKGDFIGVLKGAPQQAITADGIRYNKLNNNVGFYVNNNVPFTPQKMTGDKVFVEWEKYDTDPTEVDDAEIRYLAYDKRNEVRVRQMERMQAGITKHALYKLAPADGNSSLMPVLITSGATITTPTGQRKRATFEDLVKFLEAVKGIGSNLDPSQFYMCLCPEHVTDLIIDKDAATYFVNRDVYFDVTSGALRSFMGFKFFETMVSNIYDTNKLKQPEGQVLAPGLQNASTFFYAPNTVITLRGLKYCIVPS